MLIDLEVYCYVAKEEGGVKEDKSPPPPLLCWGCSFSEKIVCSLSWRIRTKCERRDDLQAEC